MENEEKKIDTAEEIKADSKAAEETKEEKAKAAEAPADFPKTEAPVEQPEAEEGEEEKQKAVEESYKEQADSIEGEYNGRDVKPDSAYFKPIHYINDGTISIDDEIENLRAGFRKKRKPGRVFHIVSLVLILVLFGCFLVVSLLKNAPSWARWTVFGVLAAVLITTFVLSFYFNKRNTKTTSNYRVDFVNTVNGYTLSDLHLDDATIAPDAKIEDKEIIEAHYFRTISAIQSRAVVRATRNQYAFHCAEVAVVVPQRSIDDANKTPIDYLNRDGTPYIEDQTNTGTTTRLGTQEISSSVTRIDTEIANQVNGIDSDKSRAKDEKKAKRSEQKFTTTGFFGRFFSYGACVSSDESRIIAFMGERKFTILPTYLTGFEARKVPGLKKNIIVYVANPLKSAKFFTKETIDILNNRPIGTIVQSSFLSLNSYGRKAGFNLSDEVRQCPQKRIESLGCFDTYQKAVNEAFRFFDAAVERKDKD